MFREQTASLEERGVVFKWDCKKQHQSRQTKATAGGVSHLLQEDHIRELTAMDMGDRGEDACCFFSKKHLCGKIKKSREVLEKVMAIRSVFLLGKSDEWEEPGGGCRELDTTE